MTEHSKAGRVVGGRYRLVDRLGAGGMGRVWRAHDQQLGTDVAVKEVSLPFMLSEAQLAERLSRAEREARNAVRLRDQPGIVTVHDVVIDDDVPWIVMQLVAGRSLDEHLRAHGPLSVENTAKVADTMLRALAAAHAAGIVHRDVKPANVLLADDGRVLLTDFGIAHHEGDSSLTMTGAVVGSAEYLAPERVRGDVAGPPADLFSLGVTLYHAVEGVSPFRRDSPAAMMTAVLFEQPAPPKKAGRLTALLAALLAKDPGQRPTVPGALAMLNENFSGGSHLSFAAAPTPLQPPTVELRHSPIPHTGPAPHNGSAPSAQSAPSTHSGAGQSPATMSAQAPTAPQQNAATSYLAHQTLNPPVPRKNGGNGLKVGLGVAAAVAVSALATLGVTRLTHSGNPQATTTSSSSGTGTPTTAPTDTPAPTSSGSSASTPTSADSLDTDSPDTDSLDTTDSQESTTTDSTPPAPDGAKAGCTEANRDLNAYNASDPVQHGGKDFQIQADRDLATKLDADAALATDPAVKTAIQNEADSWNTFATAYADNDLNGMRTQIPLTTKYIAAVNTACTS